MWRPWGSIPARQFGHTLAKSKKGVRILSDARNPYREGSKKRAIANHFLAGVSEENCYQTIVALIGTGRWVFSRNEDGSRVPLSMYMQRNALRRYIEATYMELSRKFPDRPPPSGEGSGEGNSDSDSQASEQSDEQGESGDGSESSDGSQDESDSEGEQPSQEEMVAAAQAVANAAAQAKNDKDPHSDEIDYFVKRVRELRKFCEERAQQGMSLDVLGMRPIEDGCKMIRAGIKADDCLHSMTMHWSSDIRKQAELKPFSPSRLTKYGKAKKGEHKFAPYIRLLVKAQVPIMLVGPVGAGKSYLAKQVTRSLGLDYGECPMTAGATPSWLLGRHTVNGFVQSEFAALYGSGGGFCFEELDAADPNMVLVTNNALANGELRNPISGECVTRHPMFVPFATANTFGLGANRDHTGRERLDLATLDRWRMGRVQVDYDTALEDYIAAQVLVSREEKVRAAYAPDAAVAALEKLTSEERERVLAEFNGR